MTKIRVRLGAAEAEVESEPDRLREAIDLIPLVAEKLSGARPAPAAAEALQPDAREGAPQGGSVLLPTVTLEKGDSLADVIGKFFADPWGRETHKLSDVIEALRSYGMNYPKQSVAVALLRLAKTTRIRRFKAGDGEFVYTSSALASQLGPPRPEAALDETAPAENLV